MKAWLAAALGSLFIMGSSSGAAMQERGRAPMNERPASTSRAMKDGGGDRPVDIACVAAAVSARETSLSAGAALQTQAVAAAYAARATALTAAYTGTDAAAVKTAVKKAWSDFAAATKGAKLTWQKNKESSWKTYREAAKACKGAESITDSQNAGTEQ